MPPKRAASKPKAKPKASNSRPSRAKKPTSTPTAASARRTRAQTNTNTATSQRAQSDQEILTAYRLFSVSRAAVEDMKNDEDEDEDEEGEGVIPVLDVRRCLAAVNLPPPPRDFFDAETRYMSWPHFLELAQTLRETLDNGDTDGGEATNEDSEDMDEEEDRDYKDDDDDDGGFIRASKGKGKGKGKGKAKANAESGSRTGEVDAAFSLFVHHRPMENARITLSDLKRIARELREDVDEKTLRMMIEDANGEDGRGSVERGVGRHEFEDVMRRAGMFSS